MAQIDVGSEPIKLPIKPGQQPVIFNAGPGDLEIDHSSGLAIGTGLPIAAGSGYEFPRDVERDVYAVSESTSDVRILVVG